MTDEILPVIALVVALAAFAGLIVLRRRGIGFTTLVLLGLGGGIALGLGFRGHLAYVAFLGDAYVQLITAIVAPLIFVSILASVIALGSTARLRTIGLSSTFWLLLTNVIAIVLTLAVALSLQLGSGVVLDLQGQSGDSLTGLLRPLDEVFLGLLPSNLAADVVSNNIVGLVLFALLFAVAYLVAVGRRETPQLLAFRNVVEGAKAVVMTAVRFVIELTPYAVLALVATTTATAVTRLETVVSLLVVLVLAVGIAFVDAYLVNGLLLRVFADVNPVRWFRYLTPAQYTAFTTQSSVGTLPLTISTLTRRVGVPDEIASFTAPVGTTIGMPGCAGIWPMIVAVFSINALGIPYGPWDYVVLAVLCLFVSIGTAGVPGTAIITATAVLTAAGLPVEVLVVLIPISAVAGTASTMANVTAAATAATIVARRRGTLDDARFRVGGDHGAPLRRDRSRRARRAAGVTAAAIAAAPSVPAAAATTAATAVIPTDIPLGECELPAPSAPGRTS